MDNYNVAESLRHVKKTTVRRITLKDRTPIHVNHRKSSEMQSGNTYIPTPKKQVKQGMYTLLIKSNFKNHKIHFNQKKMEQKKQKPASFCLKEKR